MTQMSLIPHYFHIYDVLRRFAAALRSTKATPADRLGLAEELAEGAPVLQVAGGLVGTSVPVVKEILMVLADAREVPWSDVAGRTRIAHVFDLMRWELVRWFRNGCPTTRRSS